jgi:hypothetical protein
MQQKYHVFPGLLRKMESPSPEQIFSSWLDSLSKPIRMLVFDTGTKGNGVREVFEILRAYAATRDESPFSHVSVLGIVDGHCEAQKLDYPPVFNRHGMQIDVGISYHHVDKVLTEDCAALAGYEALRTDGVVKPVSVSAVLKLLDNGN